MKTYNVVKFGKGAYIDTRVGGRMIDRAYYKTQVAVKAKIKELRAEGYEESK